MENMEKVYRVKMSDGTQHDIPVKVIADSRIDYYKDHCEGGLEEATAETIEIFNDDEYEVEDWAKNNMNWVDVKDSVVKVHPPDPKEFVDQQECWVNGENIVTEPSE